MAGNSLDSIIGIEMALSRTAKAKFVAEGYRTLGRSNIRVFGFNREEKDSHWISRP